MSKHTPGPWKFDTLTEVDGRRITCIYADTPDSPGGKTIVIRTGTIRGETESANVKLTTAAPELLEALREITDALSDKESRRDIAFALIQKAERAIAKATVE